jgi:hypothetical protein
MVVNTGGWVFDDAEPRYTIGFVSIRKGIHAGEVVLRGPFPNLMRFRQGTTEPPARFPVEEFVTWSEGASFPLLPSADAVGVFQKLRVHPRLDGPRQGWRCRPTRELHATDDREFFGERNESRWPVYKGESIELLDGDTGVYLAFGDPAEVLPYLQRKRVRQQRTARSAFSEFSPSWANDQSTLPCRRSRISFRDIARSTDSRTVLSALVPPDVFLTHLDPYLLWPAGDERDEAYLLGVLCSMPLDWYARRTVENHVSYSCLNALPIPDTSTRHGLGSHLGRIAGRLSASDDRFESWAREVGVPVGSVTEAEKPELLAELDAAVAHLYGLDEGDLRVLYDTFLEGADYSAHFERVLAHYGRLA